jgi:hypothetical protein
MVVGALLKKYAPMSISEIVRLALFYVLEREPRLTIAKLVDKEQGD